MRITILSIAFLMVSCMSGRLTKKDVRQEFEKDSGFKLPASATAIEGLRGSEDIHGDYEMVVTFTVPLGEIAAFTKLPPSVWRHPEELKPLKGTLNIAGDTLSPGDPCYQVPAGAWHIVQRGPGDMIRSFTVDASTGKVCYARQTW